MGLVLHMGGGRGYVGLMLHGHHDNHWLHPLKVEYWSQKQKKLMPQDLLYQSYPQV